MLVTFVLSLQVAAGAGLPAARADNNGPLTLSAAVAEARRSSPLHLSAVALADAAEAAHRLAGRPLNPALDVRAENWRPGSQMALPLDVFAVLSQPLELGGKRGARRDLAAADRDVALALQHEVDRRLALDTVHLYVQAVRARSLLEALVATRSGIATLVETMQRRVGEGYAAESDLLKFRTEAARTEGDIVRVRLDLARSLAGLAALIGSPTPIDAARLVEPSVLQAPAGDLAAIASAGVAARPEVVAARARLERARRVAALERARALPDPALTGGYKRTAGLDTATVGVVVNVPIFDRNGQAIARAGGDERAAALELDGVTRRLHADTVALLESATTLAARADRAGPELLEPAEGVRNAARATFREGTSDVLKLIDAERVYIEVRRAALDLRLDAFLAAVEARFALGQEDLP